MVSPRVAVIRSYIMKRKIKTDKTNDKPNKKKIKTQIIYKARHQK